MRLNWAFFVREAINNMRLNALMSATAVTTTAVCVLILGIGLLASLHVGAFLDFIGRGVAMEAYFPEEFSDEKISEIRREVEGYPEVAETRYVSREQALTDFKETLGEQRDVVEGFSNYILPASLEITLNESGSSAAVAERLQREGFGEGDLSYPQDTVDRFNQATAWIKFALIATTAFFLVASVLLISNAIRLSIFARRKEIEVMKLVGASDGFVRTPFVLEGLVQGFVGALLSGLVLIWANSIFVQRAQENLGFLPISSNAVNAPLVLAILVVVGVVIGMLGSFLSVRRFLRV